MPRCHLSLCCLILAALLAGCSGDKPEPTPAPAEPAEPKVDRATLLRQAKARIEKEREKKRQEMRAIGSAKVTRKKKLGKKKEDVKLQLEFEFENESDKELTLAEGAVEFRDAEGNLLKNLKVPFRQSIKPGGKADKRGKFPVDPAEDGDVALVKTPLKDIQVVWVPKLYRFADGTEMVGE